MPRVSVGRRGAGIAVGAAVVLLLVACSAAPTLPGAPRDDGAPATVEVERRDITSVVVVDGEVVATPQVAIVAPQAGRVRLSTSAVTAPRLAAGAVLGRVGDQRFTLPFVGRITETLHPDGASVARFAPVATAVYAGYGILATVPADELYRLYATPTEALASIDGGPGGVPCTLAPVPAGQPTGDDDGAVPVLCLLALDAAVVDGLPAKVGIETARVDGVLALPVAAVLGSVDTGVVTLVRGDDRSRVTVTLGVSDGSWVEVTAGLDDGDIVLAHAPRVR